MPRRAQSLITPSMYLELEQASFEKHEYFEGKVEAMAGASANHNRIVANVIGELHQFLKGKECQVFPSDLRVTTPLFDSYLYPDVSIICGALEKQDAAFDTCTNPSVIIEVMSPSTQDRGMGNKFWYYLQIPSLKEYILIDSVSRNTKTIIRQPDGSFRTATATGENAALHIYTINMALPFADLYQNVPFE